MPVDGGARGPGGGNSNVKHSKMFKRDGPSSNVTDGPSTGGRGTSAAGAGRGRPDDMRNGSPMKGPSMAGVLKYIRERGTGEDKAPGSSDAKSSPIDRETSPYPTGGEPLPQKDQGHDVPGESHLEEEEEGDCGHPGCTKHASKARYGQSNRESKQPGMKGGY